MMPMCRPAIARMCASPAAANRSRTSGDELAAVGDEQRAHERRVVAERCDRSRGRPPSRTATSSGGPRDDRDASRAAISTPRCVRSDVARRDDASRRRRRSPRRRESRYARRTRATSPRDEPARRRRCPRRPPTSVAACAASTPRIDRRRARRRASDAESGRDEQRERRRRRRVRAATRSLAAPRRRRAPRSASRTARRIRRAGRRGRRRVSSTTSGIAAPMSRTRVPHHHSSAASQPGANRSAGRRGQTGHRQRLAARATICPVNVDPVVPVSSTVQVLAEHASRRRARAPS